MQKGLRRVRYLLITADDFGIGEATTRGILDLSAAGRVTSSVLLVNSPHAESAVQAWNASGRKLELGWHPALTLDGPVAPAGDVASLIAPDGRFYPLGPFLKRLLSGKINPDHIHKELQAQYRKCCDLLGGPPEVINGHHHIHVFNPVGRIMRDILRQQTPMPYVRIVREAWPTLARVSGARFKRLVLNYFGRAESRLQRREGFLGNDWIIGVTDPKFVQNPQFFRNWIMNIPGNVVELTCHPGYVDETLIGRDCTREDGMLERRVRERELLSADEFVAVTKEAGFTIISPSQLRTIYAGGQLHAA